MKMEIVHQGFDGLDVAFEGQIPLELDQVLAEAKAAAVVHRNPTIARFNSIQMHVSESGAKGGYAYRCDTGPLGAVWFFKRPNAKDPWGVRVSVKSLPLAKYGLGWVRHQIHDFLERLGVFVSPQKMSIGRIDYAIDVLAPDFQLLQDDFVTHSRSKRKAHSEFKEIRSIGHSGRTTSVTIGSNPNRQVIIYDKREEVISKSDKRVWWSIWDHNRAKQGKPSLDSSDPTNSRIWRVELRAYKRHLKDIWHIRTWDDLNVDAAHVFENLAKDVRHTRPTADSNRARWPNSPLWSLVEDSMHEDLIEMRSDVPEDRLKRIIVEQQKQMLLGQFLGLGVSMAGLETIEADGFEKFLDQVVGEAKEVSKDHKVPLAGRLEKARGKYLFVRRGGE